MREIGAVVRAVVVDEAVVPVQEYAARLSAAQYQAVGGFIRVARKEVALPQAHVFRNPLDVPGGDRSFCNAAAVRARAAIDFVLNPLCRAAELLVRVIVRFQMLAKP